MQLIESCLIQMRYVRNTMINIIGLTSNKMLIVQCHYFATLSQKWTPPKSRNFTSILERETSSLHPTLIPFLCKKKCDTVTLLPSLTYSLMMDGGIKT